MRLELHYDTETTGIPDWGVPSDDPSQPHLVQLAAILYDADAKKELQSIDVIIKPNGWEIPEETIAVHGITNELANAVGVSEAMAIGMLSDLCDNENVTRVAYNKTFDQRIIRIGLKRYWNEDDMDAWAVKENHDCSMRMVQKILGGRNPKLAVAYEKICGLELKNAHSAMADTRASMEIYHKIQEINHGQ